MTDSGGAYTSGWAPAAPLLPALRWCLRSLLDLLCLRSRLLLLGRFPPQQPNQNTILLAPTARLPVAGGGALPT